MKGEIMKTTMFLFILLGSVSVAFGVNDLLVLHCEGSAPLTGVEDNIGTNPFYGSVDYLDGNAALVPLVTLQNYTCVFTWNNLQYTTGQGDILADYVDTGGKVVILGWGITQCFGRILDDPDYCPMIGADNHHVTVDMGTTYSHEILNGVSSISSIYYWVDATMESGAYLIAENTMGTPLAAINADNSIIALNMVAGDYRTWTGDGWILMNNAIEFLMDDMSLESSTWGNIKANF